VSEPTLRLSPGWRLVGHAVAAAVCLSVLVPLILVAGTAFKPANEVYQLQPWPSAPTLENFAVLLGEKRFGLYVWNSVGTVSIRVAGQLAVALLAAYAFARYEFPFREPLFVLVLAAMMIPPQLTMIPLYLLMADLDWFDTWTALIVPNLAAPYATFLLRQHLLSIPRELYEAARIDGAGSLRTLLDIVVPNIGPALAAIAIVLSIDGWNEYFWPMLMSTEPSSRTVQIGLREFVEEEFGNYGGLMAGATLASLPMLALFFVFQRRIVDTFVSSGVKG
jgi:multiple sugar transport system permease protein/sn-glycerol 3-phosphate transport system permease protein